MKNRKIQFKIGIGIFCYFGNLYFPPASSAQNAELSCSTPRRCSPSSSSSRPISTSIFSPPPSRYQRPHRRSLIFAHSFPPFCSPRWSRGLLPFRASLESNQPPVGAAVDGAATAPIKYSVRIPFGSRQILVETGHIGRQASASVTVTDGETIIYCSVCLSDVPSEPSDFFPLTVNYQERLSAAGRTSGGYFKREGRAKDHEVLICRLIDRPLRPTMPEGFYYETQILSWGLCHISEISSSRLAKAEDVVKVGDRIDVKLIEINEKGQLRLSRRALLPNGDTETSGEQTNSNENKPSQDDPVKLSAKKPLRKEAGRILEQSENPQKKIKIAQKEITSQEKLDDKGQKKSLNKLVSPVKDSHANEKHKSVNKAIAGAVQAKETANGEIKLG